MTKFQRICGLFCLAVGIILAVGFAWKTGKSRGYSRGFSAGVESVKKDTLTIVDTIRIDNPVEVIKWKDKLVYIPITDTISIHDTTYIALQFEKKVYQDSAYRAIVSGFKPSLDEIEVYQKTQTIVKTITEYQRPELSVSPMIKISTGPGYVTPGVSMRAIRYSGRLYFEGTCGYGINLLSKQPGWIVEVGAGVELIR